MQNEDVVAVERYADVIQAQFAVSVLEGSGIEAFIDTPHTAAMFPHYALATRGVAVCVRATEAERAREALAAADDGAALP